MIEIVVQIWRKLYTLSENRKQSSKIFRRFLNATSSSSVLRLNCCRSLGRTQSFSSFSEEFKKIYGNNKYKRGSKLWRKRQSSLFSIILMFFSFSYQQKPRWISHRDRLQWNRAEKRKNDQILNRTQRLLVFSYQFLSPFNLNWMPCSYYQIHAFSVIVNCCEKENFFVNETIWLTSIGVYNLIKLFFMQWIKFSYFSNKAWHARTISENFTEWWYQNWRFRLMQLVKIISSIWKNDSAKNI